MQVPGFWRMAVIGMASKLAASMTSLSMLLLVSSAYSYGTAGLAVSCSALGQGLTAPCADGSSTAIRSARSCSAALLLICPPPSP